MAKKRALILFSGTVQGVGFRFTAERTAIRLGITGWVRNLPNGSVEIVAEAEETDIQQLLSSMRTAMGAYIRNVRVSWEPYIGEFADFGIRYY